MGKISLSTSTKDSLHSFSGALWLRSLSCRMSLEFSWLPTVQVGPPTQYILLLVFATMGITGTTSSSQTRLTISCPLCQPQRLKDLREYHAMTSAWGHTVPIVTCEKQNNSWPTVQNAHEHFCPDGEGQGWNVISSAPGFWSSTVWEKGPDFSIFPRECTFFVWGVLYLRWRWGIGR